MNAIRILTGKVEREEIELNYRVSREVNLKKKNNTFTNTHVRTQLETFPSNVIMEKRKNDARKQEWIKHNTKFHTQKKKKTENFAMWLLEVDKSLIKGVNLLAKC